MSVAAVTLMSNAPLMALGILMFVRRAQHYLFVKLSYEWEVDQGKNPLNNGNMTRVSF